MSYQKNLNEQNDIVRETDQTVSSGIWSEGATTLSSFFTSSVQSGSNGAYYMQVFNKDVSDASSAKQFSILYGHKGGSGSLGKPGVEGNRETATVYGQMLNLTQPPETELFTFDSTNAATGGLHAIATGLHYSPTELDYILYVHQKTKEQFFEEVKPFIEKMNKRRDMWKDSVKDFPILYDFLLNNIYHEDNYLQKI